MDSNSNRDIGFEQRSGSFLNYQSSGISSFSQSEKIFRETASSIKTPSFSSVNTANSSFVSGRDQFISVAQNIGFKGHMTSQQQGILSPYTSGMIENQGNMGDRFGDLVCYPSDTCFFEQQPKFPCFGGEKFKEIASPFATSVSCSDYHLSDHISTEGKRSIVASRKENGGGHNDEFSDQNLASSGNPNMDHTLEELGGRKRNRIPGSNSKFDVVQSMEKDQSKVISHMSVEASKERDDKKQKNEQHPSSITTSKLTSKQAKGCSQNGDAPMDDCVHVRARRGQATNSHSLAERVRREKISERMKFLQELVPGCSKVTGKAVMLDEIINYVQSLQRQVEFLSMKLATVNPECKFDIIDQILTKDVIHSRFGPAISSRCPHLFEPLPGAIEPEMAIPGIETSGGFPASLNYQLPIMDQTSFLWDDELHGIVQMGFVSDTLNDLTKSGRKNGPMKGEL